MAPHTDGRMIRKDISDSDGFAQLTPESAVLFQMLIAHYNSHGKMLADPYYIKGLVCRKVPYLPVEKLQSCLKEISEKTNVKWFMVKGTYYLHALNWKDHQKIDPLKIGEDTLPNYPGDGNNNGFPNSTPELLQSSPESFQRTSELGSYKDKDKVEVQVEVEEEVEEEDKYTAPSKTNGAASVNHRPHLFKNSTFYDFKAFRSKVPNFTDEEAIEIHEAMSDWSASKGKKSLDWIATARTFLRRRKNDHSPPPTTDRTMMALKRWGEKSIRGEK